MNAHGSNPPAAGGFSDDDFLRSVADKLPERDQHVREVLERVKSVYVECGRDAVLAKALRKFVVAMLAKRGHRRDDGRAFFITGESGAGKSRAIEHMLATNSSLQPQMTSFGLIKPVVTVRLMGPTTLKLLGKNILDNAGYPMRQKLEQGELWDMLPVQLHLRKVLIVYVDETQHMLKHTESDQERQNLAKAFKGVMNYEPWPVSFIMSGMPRTTELSRLDEQIERRGSFCFLPDVAMPEERKLILRIVQRLSDAAEINADRVLSSDLPDRIAHAARYRYGRITQVTLAALHVALERGDGVLTREHFALAYIDHSHARGHDEMNPFLVDDWARLEPGSFLFKGHDA
ncbi:ATP-binding protein [Allomesorhizobium camelthorni]|uniref:AAA family ATPase n=1 Tax=Allomesorhizobium camelthorni TaxID=475069 RepID=A0A6G4WGX5_9HYPH|nr:ATP-binding protein [Mesorhizobium camelthorni]NGO54055.1 AAA family ATPase [Mesorhizobium camelthorni]